VVARRCSRTRALVTCFSGGRLAVERGRPGGVAAVVGEGGLAPDRGRPVGHQAGWLPRSGPRVIVVHLRQGLQVSGAATRDPRRVVGGRRCTAGRRASSCRRDRTWAQRLAAVHDRAVGGLDRHRQRMGAGGRGPTDRWPGPSRPRHDPSVSEDAQAAGVSEATYHRCQAPHGGLKANDAKRFEELEAENAPAEATGPSSDADNFSASGKSPAAD
jgi:hypothetical protein